MTWLICLVMIYLWETKYLATDPLNISIAILPSELLDIICVWLLIDMSHPDTHIIRETAATVKKSHYVTTEYQRSNPDSEQKSGQLNQPSQKVTVPEAICVPLYLVPQPRTVDIR